MICYTFTFDTVVINIVAQAIGRVVDVWINADEAIRYLVGGRLVLIRYNQTGNVAGGQAGNHFVVNRAVMTDGIANRPGGTSSGRASGASRAASSSRDRSPLSSWMRRMRSRIFSLGKKVSCPVGVALRMNHASGIRPFRFQR